MRIRRRRQRLSYVVLLLTIFITVMVICWYLCIQTTDLLAPASDNNLNSLETENEGGSEQKQANDIDKVTLQGIIDEWASAAQGKKSVIVYDLDYNELLAEYNSEESFNMASLYKLFVVYEGYQRISSGQWSANDPVGKTGYNVLKCLDLSIRESYSPCAEGLWNMIGHSEFQTIIEEDLGIKSVDMGSLIANAQGILEIMKLFYKHEGIQDDYTSRMKDSFLSQPPTEYDWRQGLPAGFTRANVYNKVGWDYDVASKYWNTYNDAAIVEIPEDNRHFAVIVMTSSSQYQDISRLGSSLEDFLYQ